MVGHFVIRSTHKVLMHCHFTQKLRILALSRMAFEELYLWNSLTFKTNSQATEAKYFIAKESKETK